MCWVTFLKTFYIYIYIYIDRNCISERRLIFHFSFHLYDCHFFAQWLCKSASNYLFSSYCNRQIHNSTSPRTCGWVSALFLHQVQWDRSSGQSASVTGEVWSPSGFLLLQTNSFEVQSVSHRSSPQWWSLGASMHEPLSGSCSPSTNRSERPKSRRGTVLKPHRKEGRNGYDEPTRGV